MVKFSLLQNFLTKMRPRRFWGLGLALLSLLLVVGQPWAIAAPPQTAKAYDQLIFPPLAEVKIPAYEHFVLPNGLGVYLMEDHQLPLVKGTAYIRSGSRWEPADKVGLGDLTATVMRTGGSVQHPGDDLDRLLGDRAASLEMGMGSDMANASFDALSPDFPLVMQLLGEVLRSPAFPEEKLQFAKTQVAGAIARRNDDPDSIAQRELGRLIYGADSPYARLTEYQTLDAIGRSDLVDFHQTYFRPNHVILGLVGDFNPKEAKALVEKTFGDWAIPDKQMKLVVPGARQQQMGGVFVVNQPQLTQSSVLLGHLGGEFSTPDYPALTVMNEVLNGFGGRLFNELRSRQGLAYSVYGYWSGGFDHPGMVLAGGQTRSAGTVPFIQGLKIELDRIRQQGITPKELSAAKESILNSFVFNFQKPEQLLGRLLRYDYYAYPLDFLFTYQKKVKTITAEDVQRVAKTHLQPDRLVTLVVGNTKEIQPSLAALGEPVKTLDVSIPEPGRS